MVVPSEQCEGKVPLPVKYNQDSGTAANDSLAAMLSLRRRLGDEVAKLRAHTVEWRGGKRKVRFWTKVIVQIVKGML